MDAQSIDLPGFRCRYFDSGGSGVPIVFLHAKTGTADSFEPQLEWFASRGYRAIAYDRRGAGQSVPTNAALQPGTIADDLDALAKALVLGPFHLVAVAGGAFGAIDFAASWPERLHSLVAAATVSSFDEPEIKEFHQRVRLNALHELGQVAQIELSAGYRGTNIEGTHRWIQIEEAASAQGFGSQPLRSPNRYEKFEGLAVPMLAIAGDADLIAPPAVVRLWTAHVPNVELEIIPDAGHSVAWEQPEMFNQRVLTFIQGVRGISRGLGS